MSTDTYVVKPMFFPGGNLGELAVYGTVNDLAVGGATPKYLSAGFVLEEGFPLDTLRRLVGSDGRCGAQMRRRDRDWRYQGRGKGQRRWCLYQYDRRRFGCRTEVSFSAANVVPGDRIVLNGSLGEHGITILAQREGLGAERRPAQRCGSSA